MNKLIMKRLGYLFTSILLTFSGGLASAAVISDDTEIYFSAGTNTSGTIDQTIIPNILFILDTSGSMTATVPQAGGDQRIKVLKDAMTQIIEDVEDVNIGLMRFTSGSGGPVLFPMSYIDENVANVVGETGAVIALDYQTTISNGDNDGEENTDNAGAMTLSENVIEVIETGRGTATIGSSVTVSERVDSNDEDAEEDKDDGSMSVNGGRLDLRSSGGSTEHIGVQFDGLSIPANSTIESAYLDFTVRTKKTSNTTVDIWGFDSNDPSDFSSSNSDLTSRARTTASVTWTSLPASNVNVQMTSPDLKTIVQEIVSRNCTVAHSNNPTAPGGQTGCTWGGDKMGFFIDASSGYRAFWSRNGSSSKAPRLRVTYSTTTSVATAGDDQVIGLRFENIKIPKDATVTDASLIFTPNRDDTDNTTWTIVAEDDTDGDSEEFQITANNFTDATAGTGRPKTTASASWVVPDWTTGVPVETTNNGGAANELRDVVQEVVNNANWCGGNSISFFITGATNSGTALREFISYENDSSNAVKFKYSYTSGTGSCYASTETGQASILADDAAQNGTTVTTNGTELALGTDTVGIRFQNVDVPVDATIKEAYLQFYVKNVNAAAASFTIKGELPSDGDANVYTNTDNDISSRSYTSGTTWVPDEWSTAGELETSVDIKTIVASMVATGASWTSGNDMSFIVEPGSGTRSAESWDSNPAFAPRLRIIYEDTADSAFKTVRETLVEVIDDLPASGATPVQETMTEAAYYWRGEDVKWGLNRANSRTSRISHPGSYCLDNSGTLDCRGADVSNTSYNPDTDQYGVQDPSGCNPESNPNDSDCSGQNIKGTPTYISPFSSTLTCQNNYQVLLTDGSANSGGSSSQDDIEAIVGKTSCYADNDDFKVTGDRDLTYGSSEKCTVDLAEYLQNNDQSTATVGNNLDGNQTVRTYTIGFNLGTSSSALNNKQFLTDIARQGKGEYFDATTAGSLVDVFNTILTDVKSDPTSFSAPSIAVNTFNRLFSRDDIYFGLFTPALETRWEGNLKKYNVCTVSDFNNTPNDTSDDCELGSVLDFDLQPAVVDDDNATDDGEFKTTARSEWTNADVAPDGRKVEVGGAGGEISDYTNRIIYTDKNNSGTAPTGTSLGSTGFKVTATNWTGTDTTLSTVRSAVCTGTHTAPDSDCVDTMNWLLGKDVDDEDEDSSTSDTRFFFSDVLHSSPNVMTYGFDTTNNKFIDKILVGSNTGGLHFINGDSGIEEWSFMPNNLLVKQAALRTNLTTAHTYGMDATPILRVEDADEDGTIESGDKVHVYMSQRRGGTSMFGLDISAVMTDATSTSSVVPKFLWRIDAVDNSSNTLDSAKGNFSRMGLTFSDATIADIKTSTGTDTVLIYAGGYDDDLDDFDGSGNRKFGTEGGKPNIGNAIYIVDADTGDLVFWISHAADSGEGIAASGADIQMPGMWYSMPSNVTVFDTDGDGLDDRLYVGDTAGNVWRVDLGADINPGGSDPEGSTVVGHFASLSTAGNIADERRIFFRPSVVQVRDTTYSDAVGGEYDYVVVTTGNRANPLALATSDRLYALRDSQISVMADANSDNVADAYPNTIEGTSNGSPIDNADLISLTLGSGLTSSASVKAGEGWYLDFDTTGIDIDGNSGNTDGEKGLAAPRVLFGTILFSTYVPEDASQVITGEEACEAQVGDGRAFNLGLLDGKPTLNWDGNDSTNTAADAVMTLGAGGIPPEVVPVYTTEGTTYLFGKENPPGKSENSALQTYWYQEQK